jgi:hypothetical protein
MLAVVQIVVTAWSKEFRGGPKAAERNRVPEAVELPLPILPPAEPAYLVHISKHQFGSTPGGPRLAGPALQVHPAEEPLHVGCACVHWSGDGPRVDYHWTAEAGMPE